MIIITYFQKDSYAYPILGGPPGSFFLSAVLGTKTCSTPDSRYKILVFLDPTLGKSYATTYKAKDSWATQPLAKIF